MDNILEKAKEAKGYIESKINIKPRIAIILGSGLGKLADDVCDRVEISYSDIPHFPVSTVKGQAGKLVIGSISGKEVIVMSGRFHYYEGYSMEEVTFPIRVFSLLGIEKLIVTNAAGGVAGDSEPGDIMIIKDHIKLSSVSPLMGPNIEEFGTRFPDMLNAYDKEMIVTAKEVAHKLDIRVKEGVYFYMAGPQYETVAEVNMIRILGGDSVGMSTVPEVIACAHSGIKVLGISCITDVLKPDTVSVTHEEVVEVANRVSDNLCRLVTGILEED